MSKQVFYFSDPLPEGVKDANALLGGKGASLKEMSRAGLAVPPGFTIGTASCARYFALGRQWPEGLEDEVRAGLERLERETGRTFGRGARPLLVSVRSGAAVSMPGMMDTLLNCGLHPGLAGDVGDTPVLWELFTRFVCMFAKVVHGIEEAELARSRSEGAAGPMDRAAAERYLRAYREQTGLEFPASPWPALVESIDAVFESWNSERAVAYRRRNDIRGLNGTAVNVQAMFPSEVSGVVFTRDPSAADSNRMIIEASYGLGESVVSGDVTPDRFAVGREDGAIRAEFGHKRCMISAFGVTRSFDPNAPSLTREQVRELADLGLRIEKHFGYPVDVEFGFAEGRFGLLQARRIRGLEVAEDVEIGRQEEVFRLRELAGDCRRCWVLHNLAETLRAPTPLTWDIVAEFMTGDGGFGRMYRDLGYRPSQRVRKEGFLELIAGRIYADPERLAELFWDAIPLAYDVQALLSDRGLLDRAPSRFDPSRADGRFLAGLPVTLWSMWQTSRLMRSARSVAKTRFESEVLLPYLAYVEAERARDLAAMSDSALIEELSRRRARVLNGFGPESLKPGFFGGLAFSSLTARLSQLLGEEQGGAAARTLTRALDGDTTFEQDTLLHDVAAGTSDMAAFLARFGHRCVGEMELATPRWREDPSYLQSFVSRGVHGAGSDPRAIHEANRRARMEAEQDLPRALERCGGSAFLEPVEADLRDARDLLPYREVGKHYLMMGYELIRNVIERLAERWDLGGRIYFLRLDELPSFPARRGELLPEIEKRRIRHQSFQRLDMPDVIDSSDLERLGLAVALESAPELKGAAVASGVGTATARVVLDPRDAGDLGPEYILVCPSTDPGWTPLFANARGLVFERGGVLSHGAIVARDFGIPAAVCANATRLIRSGDRVRVDGNTGKITIVERGTDAGSVATALSERA